MINTTPSDTLFLDKSTAHGKVFNEVVRRINIDGQRELSAEIKSVSQEEIVRLLGWCKHPNDMLTSHIDLFRSRKTPYIAMRAFRDNGINVNQFASVVSLHELSGQLKYNKVIVCGSALLIEVSVSYLEAFDADGKPNKKFWDAVRETIERSNKNGEILKLEVESVVEKMQEELKAVSPIESGFACYSTSNVYAGNVRTTADAIRDAGVSVLSRYTEQLTHKEMLPGISLRQAFLNSAFGDEAHKINPVISESTPEDNKKGSEGRFRDFRIPFPYYPLPDKADFLRVMTVTDFQHHDNYHLIKASMLRNNNIDLYVEMGDKLLELRNCYDRDILPLKKKYNDIVSSAVKQYKTDVPMNKQAEVEALLKNAKRINKLIAYLRKNRKATGQFKAWMYDMEVRGYTHFREDANKGINNFKFHWFNISRAMALYGEVESRELLTV